MLEAEKAAGSEMSLFGSPLVLLLLLLTPVMLDFELPSFFFSLCGRLWRLAVYTETQVPARRR